MIEGFNFRRNEDGLLRFTPQAIPGGRRLMWVNARHTRRATGRGEQHAGTCKIVLTLTGDQINMRCASKVEPNPGFGEIGFFVPEAMLTDGAKASWTASPVGGAVREGELPLPEAAQGTLVHRP